VSDLLESVPNFSVGRDQAVLDALAEAFGAAGVRVLDVHADADHNRSVFTVVADPDTLVEGLASAIAVAASRIDLTRHEGVHPRVGAADVVPFVRFRPDDGRPELAARALARRIAMLGV
jgi:glutamate formiminotransferase